MPKAPRATVFERTAMHLIGLLAMACVALWSGAAQAWWDGDWSYRTKINLDAGPSGAGITEPIGRTPVLLRLHAGNFDFADVKEDGSDLRFVAADDKTPLTFHIEKFDGLIEQVGLVWVDVPDLAPGATTSIWMYYGNGDAPAASDAAATYDADQVLVYHFAESDGMPRDQTSYGNDALMGGERDEAGLIGQGIRLAGGSSVRLPQSPSLAITAGQPLTWSVWMKMPGASTGVLYTVGGEVGSFTIGLDRGSLFVEIDGPSGRVRTPPGAELAPEVWHHLAVTLGDHVNVWVDGARYADVTGGLPAISGEAVLGGPSVAPMPDMAPGAGFDGELDELQIAKAVRPAGVIEAAARSQGLDARLVAFDVAEESATFGSGYLGILLRSVTIDGWVVIVILAVMAVASWLVMGSKVVHLGRVARANKVFESEFRQDGAAYGLSVDTDKIGLSEQRLTVLGQSTLYRLYVVGQRELGQRLGTPGAAQRLEPASITAIRAALDSELMRETAALNARMVLLTIAISGGPFLGLLGTVIGVMITFAAVAAAGDVNVNAIAPGIAAALVATVAGLSVAIPALFGYNFLLTRVKEQTAQMQLFVNELVARVAEAHSGASAQGR
jgi:biopolymer transport protein ExbB